MQDNNKNKKNKNYHLSSSLPKVRPGLDGPRTSTTTDASAKTATWCQAMKMKVRQHDDTAFYTQLPILTVCQEASRTDVVIPCHHSVRLAQ
jgi:hypothetical protein